MKKTVIALLLICIHHLSYAQTNEEIAGVYIKKATENYSVLEIDEAYTNFYKAIKLLDTIKNVQVARLGALIEFELKNYTEAKQFAKQYFLLVKNKKTEEYSQFLELYVAIDEKIEEEKLELEKIEKERLAKEKELRRIDSLKNVWKTKADALTFNVTSVEAFNKYNLAVFKSEGFFGLINDTGELLVKADTYKDVKSFDGFILFLNQKENPTQIFCFNSKTKQGFKLPNVSDFNALSTHYGKVMLPRGSGRIVAYPNNSLKVMVFDITSKKFVNVSNQKDLFKDLKKADKIDKYNKDNQVRIDKVWYDFGGHVGGGIYPLYLPDYTLFGFLCSIDGTVLPAKEYNNLGAFYKDKANVINGSDSFWVSQNGTKVVAPTDEAGTYEGDSKIVVIENGGFQIQKEIEGKKHIIKGGQKLELMADFLRKHS